MLLQAHSVGDKKACLCTWGMVKRLVAGQNSTRAELSGSGPIFSVVHVVAQKRDVEVYLIVSEFQNPFSPFVDAMYGTIEHFLCFDFRVSFPSLPFLFFRPIWFSNVII